MAAAQLLTICARPSVGRTLVVHHRVPCRCPGLMRGALAHCAAWYKCAATAAAAADAAAAATAHAVYRSAPRGVPAMVMPASPLPPLLVPL